MRIIHAMAAALLLASGSLFALPGFIADLYPSQNALNVPADIELRVVFANPIDAASISDSSIYIYSDITGTHKWEWELNQGGTELILRPKHWWGVDDAPFNAGERVSTTLTTRLRYMNGEAFEGFTWFYTVAVRQNYGGHFTPYATFGAGPLERFYIADFNGDRAPDLAAHDTFRDQVAVFFNDGKGKFVFSHWNPGWGATGMGQSFDFDWNGGIDLAIGINIVQFNDGSGNFVGQKIIPAWAEAYRLYDFNNDCLLDIVTNLPHLKNGIKIAFGMGNESFSDTQTVAVPFRPLYNRPIELYDLNNDGKRDIVATGKSELDRSFRGFATIITKNNLPLETLQVENSRIFAHVVYANDFNGDNYIDYAFIGGDINPFAPYYMTYLNDGTGYLNPKGVYVDTVKAYLGGGGGDIDGDGDIDFFMKSSYYYSVMPELITSRYTFAINYGNGVFNVQEERSLPYDSTSAGYGKQARLVDLDMDGDSKPRLPH